MSAREKLLERLWWAVPSADDAEAKRVAAEMFDEALKEHAHALAETIRARYPLRYSMAGDRTGPSLAADLIDPEVP